LPEMMEFRVFEFTRFPVCHAFFCNKKPEIVLDFRPTEIYMGFSEHNKSRMQTRIQIPGIRNLMPVSAAKSSVIALTKPVVISCRPVDGHTPRKLPGTPPAIFRFFAYH